MTTPYDPPELNLQDSSFMLAQILTSLGHAASCFAQTATTLSDAAHTMAVAADAISDACIHIESLKPGPTQSPQKPSSTALAETFVREDTPGGFDDVPHGHAENSEPLPSVLGAETGDEYIPGRSERHLQALVKRQKSAQEHNLIGEAFTKFVSPNLPAIPEELERVIKSQKVRVSLSDVLKASPPFRRSLLVSSEADIFPAVCAIAQCYRKLLCYMDCPASAMMSVFQKIIKGGTGVSVYAATRGTPSELSMLCKAFQKQDIAILLLPETVESGLSITATDESCIVHVGWPYKAKRYIAQINLVNYPHSILVACNALQDTYPSCTEILENLAPWPEDDQPSLEQKAADLKPKLDEVLAGITPDVKANFYRDWITLHSPQGQRYISSWSPSTLVARANLYIRNVLKYSAREVHPDTTGTSRCAYTPIVTMEFVTSNNLQSAMDTGLLNVQGRESSALPTCPDVTEYKAIEFNFLESISQSIPPGNDKYSSGDPTLSSSVAMASQWDTNDAPGEIDSNHTGTFRLRYLVNIEWDTFSAACSLIQDYDTVYCYLAYTEPMLDLFLCMLREVTNHVIIWKTGSMIHPISTPLSQVEQNHRTIFIMSNNYSIQTYEATDAAKSCVLQIGWPKSFDNYETQINRHNSNISLLVAWDEDFDTCYQGNKLLAYTTPYGDIFDLNSDRLNNARYLVRLVLLSTNPVTKKRLVLNLVEAFMCRPRDKKSRQYHTDRAKNLLDGAWDDSIILKPTALQTIQAPGATTPAITSAPSSSSPLIDKDVTRPHDFVQESKRGVVSPPAKCIVVRDEFDLIPAISLYAWKSSFRNTICYVKVVGTMQTLASQIQVMVSKPVFVVATNVSASIPHVLRAFDAPTGCLVFCNALVPLSTRLQAKDIHQVIHAGWIQDSPHYEQQIMCSGLLQKTTILVRSEHNSIGKLPRGSQIIRGAVFSPDMPEELMLDKFRDKWRNQLRVTPKKALNGCYMEWMLYHGTGPYKVKWWSILDLVTHANNFAKYVLLRGPENTSGQTMLGGNLSVTDGFVRYLKLFLAVQANILQVDA